MIITPFTIGGGPRDVSFQMELKEDDVPGSTMMHYWRAGRVPEPEVVHAMFRIVRPGDFVIDGGANIGFFTLLLSNMVSPTGRVLAIEPDERNAAQLVRNLNLNRAGNVDVVAQPLWSSAFRVPFCQEADSGLSTCWALEHPNGTTVRPATAIDDMQLEAVRLLKLDIEGSEYEALVGAERTLRDKRISYIICEMNEEALARAGRSSGLLRFLMRSYGYELFLLREDGTLPAKVPDDTVLKPSRLNTNVLFATLHAVGVAWPEAHA